MIDAQGVVDGHLGRFGTCRLAYIQDASVVASEGGGDALPAFQGSAEDGPTGMVTGPTQAGADHLRGLAGDDGDERMALGPDGLAVINGTQIGFGFGDRKTISMSVGVIWVRRRAAPSRPVRRSLAAHSSGKCARVPVSTAVGGG